MAHHTKDKGDIGLTFVIADLVRQGWIVSLPIQEHSPYDLIVTKDNAIRRIQVKFRTANKKDAFEVHMKNTWGNMTRASVRGKMYSEADIDTFAITNGNVIAYIPFSEVAEIVGAFSVRISQPKNNQPAERSRFVEDYKMLT